MSAIPWSRRIHACQGSGVPVMDFRGERGKDELLPFYEAMDEERQRDYWLRKNTLSIDGKPTHIL